jgi:hypothetical protein
MSSSAHKRIVARKHAIGGGSAVAVSQLVAIACMSPAAQAQQVPNSAMLSPQLTDQYSRFELDFATAVADLDVARSTFFCTEGCTEALYNTSATLDALVNTAASQSNGGEGPYAVDSVEQFDNALRWLAPEELFALAPIASGFGNGQVETLDNHIDANRSVSRARLFARNVVSPSLKRGYAATSGAQPAGAGFSRLNLFFDASAGFGNRSDTTDAGSGDAFDFDAREFSVGMDWRFSDNLVAGALLGYTDRSIDFDVKKSRADGKIDATGLSLLAFAQWDELGWYGNAALGYHHLGYDIYRRIAVSEESAFPDNFYAPDAAAKSSPTGSGLLANVNAGIPFDWGGWGTDLYVKAVWQQQSIRSFSEKLQDLADSSTYSSGFAFNVGKQDIKSFDTALGIKLHYVATPSFGVLVPFLRGEFHRQLEGSPRQVKLEFQGLDDVDTTGFTEADMANLRDAFQFDLRSERPDKSWYSMAAGVSAVLRGSNRVGDSGRGSGGLNAYLQYSTVFALAHYNNSAITAGLRYEF